MEYITEKCQETLLNYAFIINAKIKRVCIWASMVHSGCQFLHVDSFVVIPNQNIWNNRPSQQENLYTGKGIYHWYSRQSTNTLAVSAKEIFF
jgi:hypothetical protein